MKASALRELSGEELGQQLTEQKEALFNLRMQVATAQLDNVKRIAQVKRDIARIKTVQQQRDQEVVEE